MLLYVCYNENHLKNKSTHLKHLKKETAVESSMPDKGWLPLKSERKADYIYL